MAEKVLLKDELFNQHTIYELARRIHSVYPSFEREQFERLVLLEFPNLELKERITHIRVVLKQLLPKDYKEATLIMKQSLIGEKHDAKFVYAAYSDYVMAYGCSKPLLTYSLDLLGEFTTYFSAEFGIRRFINEYPTETLERCKQWSKSENHHQRRLASEGLRPKLPWAMGITLDYKKASEPLENLYYDDERYVTRSVANHLNDISKVDGPYVITTLKRWKKDGKQTTDELEYMIWHSLRTLIKKGDRETLEFLGFKYDANIHIENVKLTPSTIIIGESIEFSFDIVANDREHLIIDYLVTYPTVRGRKSQKVFKIKKLEISSNKRAHIVKRHVFKRMTTKKLYDGEHIITIQINGKSYDSVNFDLRVDDRKVDGK